MSIIPGIETAAPERTDTSSGSVGSPKRLPARSSSRATCSSTSSSSPSGTAAERHRGAAGLRRDREASGDGDAELASSPRARSPCRRGAHARPERPRRTRTRSAGRSRAANIPTKWLHSRSWLPAGEPWGLPSTTSSSGSPGGGGSAWSRPRTWSPTPVSSSSTTPSPARRSAPGSSSTRWPPCDPGSACPTAAEAPTGRAGARRPEGFDRVGPTRSRAPSPERSWPRRSRSRPEAGVRVEPGWNAVEASALNHYLAMARAAAAASRAAALMRPPRRIEIATKYRPGASGCVCAPCTTGVPGRPTRRGGRRGARAPGVSRRGDDGIGTHADVREHDVRPRFAPPLRPPRRARERTASMMPTSRIGTVPVLSSWV